MELSIERVEILLLIAAVVAILARRLHLPYTVGLVLTGAILAFTHAVSTMELTKSLIFTALLPPLIFEAAFLIPWNPLRRDLPVLLTLATLGILIAAGITAAGLRFLAGWAWHIAILFGVLISATDPVSVIATLKELKVGGRLRLLVEAESLFNDGTVAVLFGIALAALQGGTVTAPEVARSFAMTVFGGIGMGGLVGAFTLLLAGRTTDHLIEITFTTVAAYGSFILAEHFSLSGVLATLTAGLVLGTVGPSGAISPQGRTAVEAFWEYVAFVANSLVFLLMGIQLAQEHFQGMWLAILIAIVSVNAGRAAAVYGCCALFARTEEHIPLRYQHVLFWGGLRGALALALVLGLPYATPHRYAVISVAFGVVVFSVVVHGLTMPVLLARTGLLPQAETHEPQQAA